MDTALAGRAGGWWLAGLTLILGIAAGATAAADPLAAVLEHRRAMLVDGGSEGCGVAAPARPHETIEVGDRARRLIVALPEAYDPDLPHALVIAFHGRTSPAAKVRGYYGLEAAAKRPTVFVYPSGLPADRGRFTWSGDGDAPGALRDYRLFDAIIRTMGALYCIDREKIFAVGHSLGAWFVNGLACARGDVLRAVGTLGGAISPGTCRGETAAIVFHNPDDRLVPFARGEEVRDHLLGQNRLAVTGTAVDHQGFACVRYGTDHDLDPILWCPHERSRTPRGRYYPHRWPAATGAAIMSFFEALPATRAVAGSTRGSKVLSGR